MRVFKRLMMSSRVGELASVLDPRVRGNLTIPMFWAEEAVEATPELAAQFKGQVYRCVSKYALELCQQASSKRQRAQERGLFPLAGGLSTETSCWLLTECMHGGRGAQRGRHYCASVVRNARGGGGLVLHRALGVNAVAWSAVPQQCHSVRCLARDVCLV